MSIQLGRGGRKTEPKFMEFPRWPKIPITHQYNLPYQYSLLCSTGRVSAFARAIRAVLRPSDVVVDLGTGTGVLAIIAARLCRKVYAVERDPVVYLFAKAAIDHAGLTNRVSVIFGDARSVSLPEKADAVVCEMIDTALIAELQVPVMNYGIKHLFKESFRPIPVSSDTSVQLASADYVFRGVEFRLPHFEAWGSRRCREVLSREKRFHVADFRHLNPEKFDATIPIKAEKAGTFNSLRIVSRTRLAGEVTLGPSVWFNPPLVLPLPDEALVRKGQIVKVHLSYRLGGGLGTLRYSLSN